jgi:hypothetical protein
VETTPCPWHLAIYISDKDRRSIGSFVLIIQAPARGGVGGVMSFFFGGGIGVGFGL